MPSDTPTSLSGEGYFAEFDGGGAKTIVGLIEEWSASISVDEQEITAMKEGGVKARDYEAGLYDWTVDLSGFLSMADSGQGDLFDALKAGDNLSAYLHADNTGNYYYGVFFLTGEDLTNPVDGVADVSYSGRGKDTLDKTTT